AEQEIGALDDLGGEAVVEIVVHLLHELVAGQGGQIQLFVAHPASPPRILLTPSAARPWGRRAGPPSPSPRAARRSTRSRPGCPPTRAPPAGSRTRCPARPNSRRRPTLRTRRRFRWHGSAPCPWRRRTGRRTSCMRAC